MKIKEYDRDYQVRDYSLKRGNGRITLEWNYVKGNLFLIVLYDARKPVNMEKIIRELEEKEIDDNSLFERNGSLIYTTNNGNEKMFLCREMEYLQNNQSYFISGNEVRKGIPWGISIFIAEYDKNGGILYVYPVKEPEVNTQFIPVKVEPDIKYKAILFSQNKLCKLKFIGVQDYEDGAFEYHVDGVRVTYPIPATCMGREMFIRIPRNSEVTVRVADKYKKYYRMER